MNSIIIISIAIFIAALINIKSITDYFNSKAPVIRNRKKFNICEDSKKRITTSVVVLLIMIPVSVLATKNCDDYSSEKYLLIFFSSGMIILLITILINWAIYLKQKKWNFEVNHPSEINTQKSKKYWKTNSRPLKIIITVSVLFLLIVLSPSLIKFGNYIGYQIDTSKIETIYEADYIHINEAKMRTDKLNDIEIEIKKFRYLRLYSKNYPLYKTNYNYFSNKIDKYYDEAIKSKAGAKKLFDILLEVNMNKNAFEGGTIDIDYKENKHAMVLFSEDDRFVLTIKSDNHRYVLKNTSMLDAIIIDDDPVYYHRKLPSSHTPNSNSPSGNESSGGGTSTPPSPPYHKYENGYDDGYDSVYDDGDYDSDRYKNDWDYSTGVDDALDELGEDY